MPEVRTSKNTQNGILSHLSRADRALLDQHLEPVDLPLRKRMENRNRKIETVYFLEEGIASVVAGNGDRSIEVGIIGREGVTGVAVVLGSDRSPHETYMQVAGHGHCMAASNLKLRMRESPTLRETLTKFCYSFYLQTSQTALSNGRSKIEERLARWLLMAHDRLDGDNLTVTHEFLALMLGVRRPGVTLALKLLEKEGVIRTTRGSICLVDREGLKRISNGAYGAAEAEYRRLFG